MDKTRYWLTERLIYLAYEKVLRRRGTFKGEDPRAIIRCGRHSGFRECCIKFFVGPWMDITRWNWAKRWRYFSEASAYEARWDAKLGSGAVQYVPCPRCIKLDRKPVYVVSCYVMPGETDCRPLLPGEQEPDSRMTISQRVITLDEIRLMKIIRDKINAKANVTQSRVLTCAP